MEVVITIKLDDTDLEKLNLKETETHDKVESPNVSIYARFFDEACVGWIPDPECNFTFLKMQQQYATDLLRARGYLFLNDVYDMLGMPRTKAGQCVGWLFDEHNPVGDNCVDFDLYADHNVDFINGYKKTALLDFNVDGNILDAFDKREP